jgi:tetratricopeptide (TPR) repeat protein
MVKENIGEYWLIFETRPYMRLRCEYVNLLIACGRYRKAADECNELLRLCKTDNLGVRYTLMHIYAHLEMENEALRLFKKYNDGKDTQMLLPLTVLYYKVGKLDIAKKYLTELVGINKDTKKFIRNMITSFKNDEPFDDDDQYGFVPNTYDELSYDLHEYPFLFVLCTPFLEWADEQLKRKRKSNTEVNK